MSKPTSTLHALNPTNPTRTLCGAAEATTQNYSANPKLVTCKRCLKAMASMNIPAATEGPASEPAPVRKSRPFAVVMDEQSDRADAVLNKPAKSVKPATKPATIHLHDSDRAKDGQPNHGTWCRIPGQHTTNPADVTCKVCRAHIDGKAPLNAVPERVKQARKAFRSFVARVAYMVFMDEGCTLSGSWTVKHTNMAGDQYEVSSYGIYENGESLGFGPGEDIKQWMEEHWSCGEE